MPLSKSCFEDLSLTILSSIKSSEAPISTPLCSKFVSKPFKTEAATKSQYKEIALNASSFPGMG